MKTKANLLKSQFGIYAECAGPEGGTKYHLPYLYILDGNLDEERLKKAVETAVRNHPALFTRIELTDQGDPVQTIDMDNETWELEVEEITDIELMKNKLKQPFELVGGRLFCIRLLRDAGHFYLFIDCHHIICDGTSISVILQDINKAYEGQEPDAEQLTMIEAACAEAAVRQTDAFERDKQWYQEHFNCGDTFTQLIPDRHDSTPKEGLVRRILNVPVKKVDEFCKSKGIFRSTLFTAAYAYLLAKFAGEQEALFTTFYKGRNDERLANTVGMLVKTVPVYIKFDENTTVADLLVEHQEEMKGAREHAAYSYTDIQHDLGLRPSSEFAWHGTLFADESLMGCDMTREQLGNVSHATSLYVLAFICGGRYQMEADYNAGEYSEELITQFLESYEMVLEGFLTHEHLCDIDIASPSQTELLDSFTDDTIPLDKDATVVSMFRDCVEKYGDKVAVVYLDKKLTYNELDKLSDRIAARICRMGLGREDVVSILISRSYLMPVCALGVLKAGCAYEPLDPTYPKERLNFMMQDAQAKYLIADEDLRDLVDEYKGETLLTKEIESLPDDAPPAVSPRPEDLFILLYTSGSTGIPKGCQWEHRNIATFVRIHQNNMHIDADSKQTAYASFGFDANAMETYPTLTIGATLYIIPEEMRLDLVALNEYVEDNGITHLFMTTQVAYQFATTIENKTLKYLYTGGEKLASLTPAGNYALVNCYGPTEGVVYVTTYHLTDYRQNIPIGKPIPNHKLYIADKQGRRMPAGAVGELLVSGPQVSRGYLNRPEKTAEVFVENPYCTDNPVYSRIYRTGDIVRFLPDGNIEFVGRRDGQVKIRGFRIELKEVEGIIRQYPGIKDVTVQAFEEEGGGKFIAAYVVSDETVDIEALNQFIMEEKPPYMVPAVTMQIDAIPLNQNQKVNKRALPKPEKKATSVEETNVPMNVLEEELHEMIAAIVNTSDFGITTVLGYVGMTSILAIKLAVQVNKRFGVKINSKTLAKNGTLQSIENEILRSLLQGGSTPSAHEPAEKKLYDAVPLSYSQTGVYFDCMKNPFSTLYNLPFLLGFPDGTDAELLAQAVRTLVEMHPEMSIHFENGENGVVQVFDRHPDILVEVKNMTEEELESHKLEFTRPFNLAKGPLYHFEVIQTGRKVWLLMDVHHLVFDGASMDIFLHQLCDLLDGKPVEAEDMDYASFVVAEKEATGGSAYQAAQAWFQSRLANCEGVTEIPSDLSNPIDKGTVGIVNTEIDIQSIDHFCRQHHITGSHLTLAATFYALSRFANNDQLCITTISNARSNLDIRNTVGMFVNTLALTAQIGEQSVREFLLEVSENFDKTLTHENYPFAQIAADYDLSADIMFAYQMGVISQYSCLGGELEVEDMELNIPKFGLAFFVKDWNDKPCISLEYDNGRYSQGLMQSLVNAVRNAITAFIAHPDSPLRSISLLDKEQKALLESFNQTEVSYDDTQTVVSMFRRQASLTPDAVALVYHNVVLNYRQVDEQSERIASYIHSLGLKGEDVVSVLIPRCEWMVVASLGVLKSGCAYQPLDPSYPSERLNFMMKDADAKLLIADEELRSLVNEYNGNTLYTKDIPSLPAVEAPLPAICNPTPDSLMILLYTSGSTGVPKGCQLTHGNLTAFCHWYARYYDLQPGDRVAAYASYGFDACMMDIYPAVTNGATVYIIGDDIRLNLPDLNNYFNKNGITHSFMTTQVGCQFAMNCDNHSLRHLSVGGEKVLPLAPPTNYQMHNGYGPTECTIFTTTYQMKEYEQNAPIGKPIDNLRLYVVDAQHNLLPQGAVGELWVSGPQVSRGYLNRPEKTAEVYITNPFVEGTDVAGNRHYSRIYRTGDIVRMLPDGNVQFVGRRDGQVKIRGFRIELKEVEAVIRQYPGIKDATVQAFDYENGGKFIAAYVVSDNQVEIKELNKFISSQKPSYMIPAATMQIDKIPLNQNQKVNRKQLPKPVVQQSDSEYVAPKTEHERLFAKIFGDILMMDKVSSTDNFFDLGGTSLMVTRVVIEADKAGLHVAYGDVFAHPTPQQLARFVAGGANANEAGEADSATKAATSYDYTDINRLLQKNRLETFLEGERQSLGNVLLTGATGFLGMHVLNELLNSDANEIWCLVRGKSNEAAERRIRTLLFYYFGSAHADIIGTRLHVVAGDVTTDFTPLFDNCKIDTVFNCAANVKHFSKGTDIEDVNIGGTKNCVLFCLNKGARLVHVSTTSVGGLSINGVPALDDVLTEQKLYFGQTLDNQYVYSKFMSDRIVLEAVLSHGLNGKVVRVGNLAARSTDGEFQMNFQTNSFMGRIRVFNMLGCYPYSQYDEPTEFSPINETAHAIMLLASTPRDCTVFHAYNNHEQPMGDILARLDKVTGGVRFVEDADFEAAIEAAKADPKKANAMSSLVAYQDMGHGQKAVEVGRLNSYTTQVLYRLGFSWSPTSWDYVERMFTAIGGFGFFD